MNICKALVKHGYSNFELTILEYCEPSKCLEREGFYQKQKTKINPEYNISLNPSAPMSGRKHSDKSKQIMSDAKKGTTLSDETKQKIMSDAKKGQNHPMYGKNHTEETKTIMSEANKGRPRPEGSGKPSQQIEVTDIKNNTTTCYNSMGEAARTLNLPSHKTISDYIFRNQKKPYKARYTFKKL